MSDQPKLQLIITGDGSNTLFHPDFNEIYHSRHGALTESMHVFIRSGLDLMADRKSISIFEVGFGTGLNCLLTCLNKPVSLAIDYHGIDNLKIPVDQLENVNFTKLSGMEGADKVYRQIIAAEWNTSVALSDEFRLTKHEGSLFDFTSFPAIDLIYFDAFAPTAQAEMWETAVFQKLFDSCNPGAVLVTYCAKGQVRRNMQAAGFSVERIPGPPGKREMLRAVKMA